MTKTLPWKKINESEVRGPAGFLRIMTRRYELPDGRHSDWDVHGHDMTVAVLALTPKNEVVLVRQYRPGPDTILDEMPGGYVDEGETPLEAARRELAEESGYEGELELVGSTWQSSIAVTKQYIAVARNCRKRHDVVPMEDEFCAPMLKSLAAFRMQLQKGELTDTGLGYLALDHAGLL